jgi:predicted PurR-regulated permease PerM
VPEERRRGVSVALLHAYRRAWGYTVAMVAKAVGVGLATYLLARALRLPASSVLALVVAAGSLVPYLGIALAGITLVLLAAGLHGGWEALIAVVAIIGLQAADAAVTAYVIQQRTLRVGPAISLAVVLIGTSVYGLGGAAVALCVTVFAVAVAQEGLPDVETRAAAPERTLP